MDQALASSESHDVVLLSKMPAQGDPRCRSFEWRTPAADRERTDPCAVGRVKRLTSTSANPMIIRRKTATRSNPNYVLWYSEIDRLGTRLSESADVG